MIRELRYLVHFVLFYTCVEGLVINIRYPDMLAYVYKDIVIAVVYLFALGPRLQWMFSAGTSMWRIVAPLLAFAILTTLYLFWTPALGLGELVALKQRLFYIPLVWVAYLFIRSDEDVRWVSLLLTAYAVLVALFGVYLYFAGPGALRSLGANYSSIVFTAPAGMSAQVYWRVPSTFNSPGQFGSFLYFQALVVVGVLMTPGIIGRTRIFYGGALATILVGLLASGTRGPIVLLTASVALAVLWSRRLHRVVAWSLAGYALMAYAFLILGPDVQARFGTITAPEQVERFKTTFFGQLFIPDLVANPLGSGLGIATVGARHFSATRQLEVLRESYFGVLAVEMGLLGVLVFLWAAVAVGLAVARLRPTMRGAAMESFWLCLATFVLFNVIILPVSTAIDTAPTNLQFWFTLGLLMRMADLRAWHLRLAYAQATAAPADTQAAARLAAAGARRTAEAGPPVP